MTYGQLLIFFIVAPSAILAALVVREWLRTSGASDYAWRRAAVATLLVLIVVATIYTIPWDGHLIAMGVWSYRPSLLIGIFAGRIPLEEVLFFPLQTLLVGLWFFWLAPRLAPKRGPDGQMSGAFPWRAIVGAAGALVWLGALLALLTDWRAGTYLGWELVWALPPLLAQILIGGDLLWRKRGLVEGVVVPAALYLCCVDALAIHLRIWTIDPHQALGLLIAGALPLEEFVFFLVTTMLIGFGLVLGSSTEMRGRVRRIASHATRATPDLAREKAPTGSR